MFNVLGIIVLMFASLVLTYLIIAEITSDDKRNPASGLFFVILTLLCEGYLLFFVLYPWAASQQI